MKNGWKLHPKVSFIRHLEALVLVQREKEEAFRFTPDSIFFFDALRVPRTIAQLIPHTLSSRARVERELHDFCRTLEERRILVSSKAVAVLPPPEIFSFPRLLDSLSGIFIANLGMTTIIISDTVV